jgi:hypothetical protein
MSHGIKETMMASGRKGTKWGTMSEKNKGTHDFALRQLREAEQPHIAFDYPAQLVMFGRRLYRQSGLLHVSQRRRDRHGDVLVGNRIYKQQE